MSASCFFRRNDPRAMGTSIVARFSTLAKKQASFLTCARAFHSSNTAQVKICHLMLRRYNRWLRLLSDPVNRNLCTRRLLSSSFVPHPTPSSTPEYVDPFKLAEQDLMDLYLSIKKHMKNLGSPQSVHLRKISGYYFDGEGKAFRPVMVVLMARAMNCHVFNSNRLLETQRRMAIIAEMIHTASLVHDDVIDTSDTRRGKSSINTIWGHRKAILAGDYILAQASRILAQLGNNDVVHLLTQVLVDLVQGEFMQMDSDDDESNRFANYLQKTFKKTASLTAYTCQAAAVLGDADQTLQEIAFQYGRNVGIAFQLIDDLLDFISSQTELGKPAAADLRLGLATAPVLFASQKNPELKPLIMRRFSNEGDVEKAYEAVLNSDGLTHTKVLARQHCDEALKHISLLADSMEKKGLISIVERVLERSK